MFYKNTIIIMESYSYDINESDFNFEDLAKNNISLSFFENQESIDDEKQKPKKIWHPRPYQQQMFEQALNQNSIIYAETGKGKTFISIMLMANHLGIDIKKRNKIKIIDKNKKIIFFVCDTTLINQQKKHIEEILDIDVGTIQGKKDKKSKSDYEIFLNKWNSFNVFVAIPEIIYKILSCGFINIFQITMLIFDECHNTADDHPYNKIMKEFYFFYKNEKKMNESKYKLPVIYGLTASPLKRRISGNSNLLAGNDALIKLSENLDSVVIIDPEMINIGEESKQQEKNKNEYIEISTHEKSEEYKEVVKELVNNLFKKIVSLAFGLFPDKYKNYVMKDCFKPYLLYVYKKFLQIDFVNYNNICQENSNFYKFQDLNKVLYIFEEMQRDIFLILENLSLESLIIYFDKLIQLYDKAYQKKFEKEEENESSDDSTTANESKENEDSCNEDEELLLNLDANTISKLKNFIQLTNDELKSKKKEGKLYYVSDRLNKLYNTLAELFLSHDKSKIIIFIANRIIAHLLKPTLSLFLKEAFPNQKCEEVIGVNKRAKKSSLTLTPSITLNKLNQIIKDFNEDKFDILIGTSAIEEGLDIQSCNAVISLVEIQTPKSYIQMKGRARKTNSKFYIFSYSKEETKKKVKNFLDIGIKMRELFDNGIKKDFRRQNFILGKKDLIYYNFNEQTHAKLTLNNASVFYNEIKQQMDNCNVKFSVDIKVNGIPNYEQKFIGKMKIETNLPNFNRKKYETDICTSKDEAKKMCQYQALVNLIESNYLDEHLKFCKGKVKKNNIFI